MKLSSLCQWLDRPRRALFPFGALILLLPLAFFLPGMLWVALAAPAILCCALYLLYRVFGLCDFPSAFLRQPTPADAMAQTVLIDADLVDEGLSVQAVAQPVSPATELSLRLGSGALLLGTAMTLLSGEVPEAAQAAIHRAVTRLNIRPDRMKAHSPILHREQTEDYTAVTVQDGPHERTYYLATAAVLSRLCTSLWEDADGTKGPRTMSSADRSRILDAAAYMQQSNGRVLAYATALGEERPTFLGLCALGQRIRMDAVQELSRLKDMGLAVLLRDADDPAVDAAALRRVLDIPDVYAHADVYLSRTKDAPSADTLTIRPDPDQPLSAPVLLLRTRFARAERILTAFALTLAVLLLCCFIGGSAFAALAAAAILLCGACTLGLPEDVRHPSPALCLTALTGTLLLRLFLSAAAPGAAAGACGLMCTVLSFAAALLHEDDLPVPARLFPTAAAALLLAAVGLLLTGTTPLAALLAVLFSAIAILSGWLLRK